VPAKFRHLVLILLIALVALVWIEVAQGDEAECQECVTINFLDVGQGDATLIELGGDQQLLIDGGPDESVLYELGRIMPLYDRTIEYVMLSHPHSDHLVGLEKVLEQYNVGQVITADIETNESNNQYWQSELSRLTITQKLARTGQEMNLSNGVSLKIFWPKAVPAGNVADNQLNNLSIICELVVGDEGVVFLGDAMANVQDEICSLLPDDIENVTIKAAHHGGDGTVSDCLINRTQPEEVVISVGANNSYGHPVQSTLDYFDNKNISVIRTDTVGTYSKVLK